MSFITVVEIKKVESDIPYHLLTTADPSKSNIDKYLKRSVIYGAYYQNELIGCYVLFRISDDKSEIKNVAVIESHQGKGVGKLLIAHAIEKSRTEGRKELIIGTGNSSIAQIYLYQKMGFRITRVIPEFFIKHYQEPIMENGIQCRDMIILKMILN